MTTVSVVTGANSGIGRAIALYLAGKGHEVYGTVRSTSKATKLLSLAEEHGVEVRLVELDVADDDSVRNGMAQLLEQAAHVDVLVNNAGVGGNGVVEECTPAEYLDVMNINLCGAVRCIQAVLPGMRERRSGAIVNITSITGRFAALAQSTYVASKWAFEGISEGLAQELAPFGIRVVIIAPGVTKSAIFAKNLETPNHTGAYDAHNRRMLQFYAAGIAQATDPNEVAQVVYEAITTDKPKLRYAMSWGSQEVIDGRARMSDDEWVALGAHENDDDYYDGFRNAFGLELRKA